LTIEWRAKMSNTTYKQTEMERISQHLTQRIKELTERYETTLPQQTDEMKLLEEKVNAHLAKMGFAWK